VLKSFGGIIGGPSKVGTTSTSFDDYIARYLADRENLVTYLQVAEEEAETENDPEILRIAARRVIRVNGLIESQCDGYLRQLQTDGVSQSGIAAIQAELLSLQELPRTA
jgi:hypothetical protein